MGTSEPASFQTMTITGGDEWTVEDLTELLGHIYVLYNRISVLREKRSKKPASLSRQMYASKRRVRPDRKMTVDSLTIQSPMEVNLKGSGEIVEQVREGIKDIYRNPLERKKLGQQLQHDAKMNKIEVAEAKLKLIRSASKTMEEIGVSDEERQAVLKALLDPAMDAARMIEHKDLTIE